MKQILTFLFLIALTSCTNNNLQLKTNYSNTPATDWRDALISGNGEMGILVFGQPRDEKIIFNHEFLYEFLGTETIEPANISNVIPKVKQLIKEKKYAEAKALTLDEAFKKGHPDLLWTDPYHPACVLNINQSFEGEVSDYQRTTTYNSGEILVSWKANDTEYLRSSFVSRTDNIIATCIESSAKNAVNASFSINHQMDKEALLKSEWTERFNKNIEIIHPEERTSEFTTPLVYPEEKKVEDNWITFRVEYQVYDRGYEVIAQIKNDGGSLKVIDDKITVRDANSIEILAQVIPIEPYSNSEVEASKATLASLGKYSSLLLKHSQAHGEIFNRIHLNLDKTGFTDGSNEELIQSQKDMDEINPYLLEKMFNMGIYGLISSSGQNPPNLMGIWNGEWRPTWSGDFTTDANINLQIAGANLANLPEAINSYMTMLERIAPDWEINAKNLYGCRGYLASTRTSGRRDFHTHFGRWPGHYWTAGAEWLLLPCYNYYLCTGDIDFLKDRLLPMMEKVALFYEDFLDTYDENGKFFFAPSYSPENFAYTKEGRQSAVANATMDIAAAKEALLNIIAVHEELNIENKKITLWKEMVSKMPPYLINEDGALKEWVRKDLGDYYNHRHVSHLYPVWPGMEITPETPELFEAAAMAIEKRGRGDGSAHGLAYTALVGSRLKDSELVYGNLLYILKNNYLYNSLFTSHNPGRIYNSDALHSLPAVVLEMLVYSRPGVIELLPACSDKLAKGSVSGVMCRTQAKVEDLEWDFVNKSIKTSIFSTKDQTVDLTFRKGIKNMHSNTKLERISESTFTINLSEGESVRLEIEMY